MKKSIKRLVAVLVVMTMIVTMCSTALAAGHGNKKSSQGSYKSYTKEVTDDTSVADPVVEETADTAAPEDQAVDEAAETPEETNTSVRSFDGTVDGSIIHVEAPEGAFPAGTEMKIEKVSDPDILMNAIAALDEDATYSISAVDISFWNDGTEIEPDIPVEVTWESSEIDKADSEIVHVEDDGNAEKITDAQISDEKAVFTAESFSTYTTTRKDSITTEDMAGKIVFNPSSLTPTAFNSGEIASTHPSFDGYTFNNATLITASGTEDTTDPVVYIGAFIYTDEENPDGITYIYYRTESTADDSDLIVRLVEGEKIQLNYDSTPLTVTYRVIYGGTTYTLNADGSLPDELKAALGDDADALIINGPSAVATQTSYERAVTVEIPRGYSATGTIAGTAMSPALGASSEPTYTLSSDNKVITKSGELALNGVYDFPSTTSTNPVVTINLSKRSSFTFDASYFLSTVYTGGSGRNTMGDSAVNTNSNARVTGDGSLGRSGTAKGTKTFSADAVSWSFTTNNTESSHWLLDALEINGTTIEVPYGNNGPVSKETVLPSGTVVKVTLNSVTGTGRNARRNYTIAVSNCYENVVISGGNIYNADNSTEIIPEVLDNVTFDFYGFSSSDNAYSTSVRPAWIANWGVGEPIAVGAGEAVNSGSYDMYRFGQTNNNAMRFSIPAGYVNPQLAYVTSTEGDLHSSVTLGSGLSFGSGDSEHYYPVNGNPTNGYYYFRITGIGNNNKLALLRIKAELARYGVSYDAGEVSDATIPSYDYGGYYDDAQTQLRGYNVEDNDYIVLDKSAPVDPNKEYIFLYYTIQGDTSGAQYAPSQKIPLSEVSKFGTYDASKGEYVIPFVAHWEKKEEVAQVTVEADVYLDDKMIETVYTNVPENSSIYVDIDSETMTDIMDKYNWQLFYDEMESEPFINNVTEETDKVELRLYSKFYVYHSATDTLELHSTKEMETGEGDARTIGTLNLAALTTDGFYYGGYYKDYLGAHTGNTASGANLVKAAADLNNSDGTLTTQDIVALSEGKGVTIPEYTGNTQYDPVNNEAHLAYWTRSNAFTTTMKNSDTSWFSDRGSQDTAVLQTGGTGTAVTIARAGIYYLHEVPADYLATPQVATVKDNYGQGDITKMFLLSAADLNIFKAGGTEIVSSDTKGSFAKNFTLTKYDDGTDSIVKEETKTAKDLFNVNGYLIVTDGKTCMSDGEYTLDPYWITYDNVTIHGSDVAESGHVRTINVSGNTVE